MATWYSDKWCTSVGHDVSIQQKGVTIDWNQWTQSVSVFSKSGWDPKKSIWNEAPFITFKISDRLINRCPVEVFKECVYGAI